LEKKLSGTSYFNLSLPYVSAAGSTPPPPYFSSPCEEDKEHDKRWIELLERQNSELMEQLTTLCNNSVAATGTKRRPLSLHGSPKSPTEPDIESPSMASSNLLVQKQLAITREELVKARRRCAELSEVEARKKGLELRCLGLERVVEELMSAMDVLKMEPAPDAKPREHAITTAPNPGDVNGLGLHMEDETSRVNYSSILASREMSTGFAVSIRRRFIPYRLRVIILYLIGYLRGNNLVDQVLGMAILFVGSMLLASFIVIRRGRAAVDAKATKFGWLRRPS
jgi:hypothetical protein